MAAEPLNGKVKHWRLSFLKQKLTKFNFRIRWSHAGRRRRQEDDINLFKLFLMLAAHNQIKLNKKNLKKVVWEEESRLIMTEKLWQMSLTSRLGLDLVLKRFSRRKQAARLLFQRKWICREESEVFASSSSESFVLWCLDSSLLFQSLWLWSITSRSRFWLLQEFSSSFWFRLQFWLFGTNPRDAFSSCWFHRLSATKADQLWLPTFFMSLSPNQLPISWRT